MEIVTRAEWGAAPPNGAFKPCTWRQRAVIHHTAGEFVRPATGKPGPKWWLARYRSNRAVQKAINTWKRRDAPVFEREKTAMRQMQSFHQRGHGWTDIGYHFVIFPSGRVYEGRPANTVGAHALNGNLMPGISFAGNYERDEPTTHQLAAYNDLLDHLGITEAVGHYRVVGNSTACPGKHLKARLGV